MTGDVLMCTWQDVAIVDEIRTPKTEVEDQTVKLSTLPGMSNFNNKMSVWGKQGYREYRKFLVEKLVEENRPLPLQYQEIEDVCWTQVRGYYQNVGLQEHQVMKLWMVFNRLCNLGEYPPTLSKTTADWLMGTIRSILAQDNRRVVTKMRTNGLTFQQLLQHMVNRFAKAYTLNAIENCIAELYRWLVAEETKVGWMYRRTKKQANWTPWTKSWFVLMPCKLVYYQTPSDKKVSGEIILMQNVKVEGLPKLKGVVKDFNERFRISNGSQNITECRVKNANEKMAWVTAVDAAKCSPRTERTPTQVLLQQMSSSIGPDAEEAVKMIESHRVRDKNINTAPDHVSYKQANLSDDCQDEDCSYSTKLKAAFYMIDTSKNGVIEKLEFSAFLKQLGLKLDEESVKQIFDEIDIGKTGKLSLDEFIGYFTLMVIEDNDSSESDDILRKAFVEADRDQTGSLDFKEFSDYTWERKRIKRLDKVMEEFGKMTAGGKGSITPEQFKELTETIIADEEIVDSPSIDPEIERQLEKFFDNRDSDEIVTIIQDRWEGFVNFRRYDKDGNLVMSTDDTMEGDFVPGEYSLIDLACFSDLPPIEPKHRSVNGVTWKSSLVEGKSGQVIFPSDFDGKIPQEIATSERLRYYGCSFADAKQTKVSLLYRHGIQDFTYENGYLDDFVLETRGGVGIEKHGFTHLDCPADEDNGIFVIGKLVDDNVMYLTGFKVPKRHTLYIPGGTIHSNDYLKGSWRTMLSDETPIDHVVTMVKEKDSDELSNVTLTFY